MAYNEDSCESCLLIMEEKYLFVQYFNILGEASVAIRAVDQKL